MICAEDELGIGNDHAGIKVLPADAPVGTSAKDYLHLKTEAVIEYEITANRVDAASHIGVARDLYAWMTLNNIPCSFKDPSVDAWKPGEGKGIQFLAQGTIYPDVIESAKSHQGKAHVIKSHHNVGGLPDDLQFKLIEPLRDLFKDEVRKLGVTLGLPEKMIYRHPFPGPGLGVRILGEVKKEYADILRQADAIFMQELERSGWYDKTAQAFAVFQPIKSVGVVGDGRRYAWVIALRAVETVDFMTARFAHLPYDLIETVSNRIMNEIAEVSRVTYDVSSKPPATLEWE